MSYIEKYNYVTYRQLENEKSPLFSTVDFGHCNLVHFRSLSLSYGQIIFSFKILSPLSFTTILPEFLVPFRSIKSYVSTCSPLSAADYIL